MLLARAIGSVVATKKDPQLAGLKLLILQPLDGELGPAGKPFVASDAIGTGPGEVLFYARGGEAVLALPEHRGPSDQTVVGIIDLRPDPEGGERPC